MTTTAQTHLDERVREVDRELAAAGVPAINDAERLRELLGFENVRSVHRAIERHDLAAFKIGNRWRIRRSELARLIALREES